MESPVDTADVAVLRFAQDALAFCAFIDGLVVARPVRCFTTLLRVLSDLAASASNLPFKMPARDVPGHRMTHEDWSRLAQALGNAFAPDVSNLVERYAADENELARITMLWDDVADLYQDLKEGLDLFALDTADARANALWTWRFGYENHWGRHLMRALLTVHEIHFGLHVD